MYLTCAPMDPLRAETRRALSDCCDMHRNVMRLFQPSSQMRAHGHILYRVLEEAGEPHLYITSDERPNLEHAVWLGCGRDARVRSLAPVLESFAPNAMFRFDLLTHPSKKVNVGRSNSARVFLRAPEQRQAWLERQGEKNGFKVCALQEELPYDIRGKRSTGPIALRVVRFIGVLRVTDASAFSQAYVNGIGPEKAYGLGMLMLRRG